ncbi:hypothetical protein QBC41DRAFT_258817 [Cercophora samala]|uniref:NACHT domain-containing protein n=1 Tax=Cercophora samala TaxID=330535 RepID=A0AA40D6Y6_9PEZI|nr:hypothetical protein QBC41DRAFT_258817 [Cercophora samala]
MEPLSALSVAAAAVQFIDWGARVLSESRERYISAAGHTLAELEVSQIAADLSALSSAIQKTITEQTNTQHYATHSNKNDFEAAILSACQECQEIAGDISSAIHKTTFNASSTDRDVARVLQCFFEALMKSSKGRVEVWNVKLASAKQKLMTALMGSLWARTSVASYSQLPAAGHESDLISILKRIEKKVGTESPKPLGVMDEELDPRQQAVINTIWSPDWLGKGCAISSPNTTPQPETLQQDRWRQYCSYIIDSFRFDSMLNRETNIPQAYQDTYSWVFEKPRVDSQGEAMWSDFSSWLEDPSTSNVYWITGKPGAGKSTLMKYIMTNSSLQFHLGRWASGGPLLIGNFYFWLAGGDQMQRSREGLLFSLLCQILNQDFSLVPVVCPRRWALMQLFGTGALRVMPKWELPELMETLSAITSRAGKSFHLALLIDGLDEFGGDHESLVTFVKDLSAQPGIKIVVSSRPWNVFQDHFEANPRLKVESLTEPDIRAFVTGEFGRTKGYLEFQQANPREAESIVREIISKAQGVFLWVSLVIAQLRVGLTEGNKLSELYGTLQGLPDELSDLYEVIWDKIGQYRQHSAQLFQIHTAFAAVASDLLPTLCSRSALIWLADEGSTIDTGHNIFKTHKSPLHVQQIMKRRLASRTRGLLEITPSGGVEYLHRTARDWMLKQKWPDILSTSGPNFDVHLSMFDALTTCVGFMANAHIPSDYDVREDTEYRNLLWLCLSQAALVSDREQIFPAFMSSFKRFSSNAFGLCSTDTVRSSDDETEWYFIEKWNAELQGLRIGLLQLATLFGVLPFVRHELSKRAKTAEKLKLLNFAVLGSGFYTKRLQLFQENELAYSQSLSRSRAEIVKLLLEHIRSDKFEVWFPQTESELVRRQIRVWKTQETVPVGWEEALGLFDKVHLEKKGRVSQVLQRMKPSRWLSSGHPK